MSIDATPIESPAPVLNPFAKAVHEAVARLSGGAPIPASTLMLIALREKNARTGARIYAGTVSAKEKGRRRAANKRARVARRAARA